MRLQLDGDEPELALKMRLHVPAEYCDERDSVRTRCEFMKPHHEHVSTVIHARVEGVGGAGYNHIVHEHSEVELGPVDPFCPGPHIHTGCVKQEQHLRVLGFDVQTERNVHPVARADRFRVPISQRQEGFVGGASAPDPAIDGQVLREPNASSSVHADRARRGLRLRFDHIQGFEFPE